MVREFTLVDGSGEEYSLTNEEHLLYNPSGLGFEHENTYRQVGNRFILANSVPKQSVISGTVHFSAPDAYYDYQEFIEFCGRDNLKMEYRLSEMPSRKVKRLIGTVIWADFATGQYSGTYDFITGEYLLTEKLITCDANTVINTVTSFNGGAANLYSISISENRDVNELLYCNGIPASNGVDVTNLNVGASNCTRIGGDADKIYFSLHNDALQGKTVSQWAVDNNLKFSYTLANPISGINTTYKFNPKLMYSPMANFISINDAGINVPSSGQLSYIDTNQETVYLEGDGLVLEDTEMGQELSSLVVHREISNKDAHSRFKFVGTDLISDENRAALSTGVDPNIYITYNGEQARLCSTLPIGYMSSGLHSFKYSGRLYFTVGIVGGTLQYGERICTVSITQKLVKDNGDDTYTEIASASTIVRNIIFDGRSSQIVDLNFDEQSITFVGDINSIIYPKILISVTNVNSTLLNENVWVQNYALNNCSFRASNIGIGDVNVADIKAFPSKSIAQISQADSQHYQRAVRLNKVEKTELTKFSSLETKVEFECLEPWGDPFTSFVEHGTSPDPVNSITFDTDCHALSPCDLYISGPCTNPTWTQTVNGVEVTTGGYTGTIAAGEKLLIRAKEGACGIYKIGVNDELTDVYKYSDFSKDRFVYIRYGENVITVTDGTDPTTQIDCYIEGELYYESV